MPVISIGSGIALIFYAMSLAHTHADDVMEYGRAEFMLNDAMSPPEVRDPRWHPIELPHLWSKEGYTHRSGWYRLRIPAGKIPEELQGIYIFRLNMNAALYFNGEPIGDGGRMEEPIARNWNRPLYFNVPNPLWRKGDNELLIHLRTYPGFGMLAPPQIAPDRLLKPRYLKRQFLQNELSLAFTILLTAVGCFTLGLWLRRRHDGLYLWFSCSCFCWTIFNSSLFVRYPFISPTLFQKLTHISLDFWMVFLTGFMHRYLGKLHPNREKLLMGLQALLALPFLFLPLVEGYNITHLAHAMTLSLSVYLTVLTWQEWISRPRIQSLAMAGVFSAQTLAGLHDWLMENPIPGLLSWETLVSLWRNQFHFLFFMVPGLIIFLAWHLTQRFVAALNEAENLNRELEERVSEAHQALAASYEEKRLLEREQAASEERERIYQDLHDDVGAKLLGLAISAQRANLPKEADLARSALQDLRDVVSRSSQTETPLGDLLADWRAEIEQRVSAAGLTLDWHMAEPGRETMISTETALHLSRILREAVTNVLRHAEASFVRVAARFEEGNFLLDIEDDGKGFSPEEARLHRGLNGMKARATLLKGRLDWKPCIPKGCSIQFMMPLPPEQGGENAV